MNHYPYLIIGGGMTAAAAIRGIRMVDGDGAIGLLSSESHPPYKRPFLSKALWKQTPFDKVWSRIDAHHLELHLATTAMRIDRDNRFVEDDRGRRHGYDKLLLATGGSVRLLPRPAEGLIHFRTLDDYHRLRQLAERKRRFAVVGGGFIGSEIAAALAMSGSRVTMIFPEAGIGARIFPPGLSRFLNDYYRERGVELLAGESVDSIEKAGDGYRIETAAGAVVEADGVVVGVGIRPETGLAEAAGLETDNGIVVDAQLRSSDASIYAAGDVANFFCPPLGKRMRVEHEDNANVMGEMAGQNMAGRTLSYEHLPFFYSDLFELGYEAVGETDAHLAMVEEWRDGYNKGIVYYLDEGRVRGVLLWNSWGQMEAARTLITEPGPFDAASLIGRLG